MKSKIVKFGVTFLLSFSLITPFLINKVSAAQSFNYPIDEPSTGENQGYLTVLMKNKSSGVYSINTYVWNITNETSNGGFTGMQVQVTDSSIKLTAQMATNDTGYSFIYRYNYDASTITVNQYQYFTTSCTPYEYSTSTYKIVGFHAKGNVKTIDDGLSTHESFSVNWGSDTTIADTMADLNSTLTTLNTTNQSILDEVESISGNVSTIKTKVNNIYTKVATIDTNVSNIYNQMVTLNTNAVEIKTSIVTGFESVANRIGNFQTYFGTVMNSYTTQILKLASNIENHVLNIKNLLSSDSNYQDQIDNNNNVNNDLSNNVNDYNDLENGFHNSMNDSLQNIQTDIDLIQGNDFIKTANFISTNINRIVTSNPYYSSFVITGLVLGIALVMIGKKVI